MGKRILLTSGGTKVKIDRVRNIGNMSKGTFGSMIGRQLAQMSEVDALMFLHAKGSKTPFSVRVDANSPEFEDQVAEAFRLRKLSKDFVSQRWGIYDPYREREYETFEDYERQLFNQMKAFEPDVVILAAAVSDFVVGNYVDGKIRSQDELRIDLVAAEKLIGRVKKVSPTVKLVGFKLLVDSTDEQLIEAAKKSVAENGCEIVVANDLRDIENREHRVITVFQTPKFGVAHAEFLSADHPEDREYLASVVAQMAVS